MTVRELAQLARHIVADYPQYYRLYGEREFTFNKIRQQNRNPLLAMNIGADGLKTGFTSNGGYGLVGSAVQNGLRLIIAINGLKSEKERADEGKKLLPFGGGDPHADRDPSDAFPVGTRLPRHSAPHTPPPERT